LAFKEKKHLYEAQGRELYTKRSIADFYPPLRPFLYRQPDLSAGEVRNLNNFARELIKVHSPS
jgi:hypothetical protein